MGLLPAPRGAGPCVCSCLEQLVWRCRFICYSTAVLFSSLQKLSCKYHGSCTPAVCLPRRRDLGHTTRRDSVVQNGRRTWRGLGCRTTASYAFLPNATLALPNRFDELRVSFSRSMAKRLLTFFSLVWVCSVSSSLWRAVAANGSVAAAGPAVEKALQQLATLAGLNMSSRIDVSSRTFFLLEL